jgi:hypothetical protein
MADHTGTPAPNSEALVVARMLGRAPEQLTSIKLRPGESDVSKAPKLSGFDRSTGEITFTTPHGHTYPRPFVRYDSPNGALFVVPHEDGSEIWMVIEHAKDLVELAGGIAGLIAFFKAQPHDTRKKVRRRGYTAAGEVEAGSEHELSDGEQTDKDELGRALRPDAGGPQS